jgi:serine/threonine protein kinase/CRP-like cAMP-binding protein
MTTPPEAVEQTFGRYRLLQRLAEGGMAELFLARLSSSSSAVKPVVIKRILPQFSSNLTFVSMFIDEARISIGLEHDNIVRLHDFGQVDGAYFMAMEYVEGKELGSLLKHTIATGQRMPLPAVLYVASLMLRGLQHAHEMTDHRGEPMRIVHRDVSPQNTLLSIHGEVKVADFGIAAAQHKLTMTQEGVVLGKASYMSPEHAYGHSVDARADVWAVGVILWEMLVGERLFADESPMLTLERVARQAIIPPSHHHRNLPAALDLIVMSMLQRDRNLRCPSARAAATQLEALLRTIDPAFGAVAMSELLKGSMTALPIVPPPEGSTISVPTGSFPAPLSAWSDEGIERLLRLFAADADLWLLVAIGDRALEIKRPTYALSAYRLAATLFAYRGLPIQSLAVYALARPLLHADAATADMTAMAAVRPGKPQPLPSGDEPTQVLDNALLKLLRGFDNDGLFGRCLAAHPALLNAPRSTTEVPLLSPLGPQALAQLSSIVRPIRIQPGQVVVREGDAGDALFAVAHGRFLVHCQANRELPAGPEPVADVATDISSFDATRRDLQLEELFTGDDRVFLSSLSDGDFFGEFSFLTGRPRIATVESMAAGLILEVERSDLDSISTTHNAFHGPLLDFYKARVAELLMAKSPLFSLFSLAVRRKLLRLATIEMVGDGQVVVQEGVTADAVYLIRKGEVEVFRAERDGTTIFINKLVSGQFFGEIASFTHAPRTSSVRAIDYVELLRIPSDTLQEALQETPRATALVDAVIAQRTRETKSRVRAYRQLFVGT